MAFEPKFQKTRASFVNLPINLQGVYETRVSQIVWTDYAVVLLKSYFIGLSQRSKDVPQPQEIILPLNIPDQEEGVSYLGTPYQGAVTFGNILNPADNKYIDQVGETREFTPIRLIEAVVEVSQTKTMKKTMVNGRNGTIKEYSGLGDYMINIRGKISGDCLVNGTKFEFEQLGRQFPTSYLTKLVEICKIGYRISITNKLLNEVYGIEYVVIEDWRMPQEQGKYNNQMFEITCSSDELITLEITEAETEDLTTLKDLLNV